MTPDPYIDLFLPGREPLTQESRAGGTHGPSWKDLVENKPQWIPVVHPSSSHLYKIVLYYMLGPSVFQGRFCRQCD